MHDLKLLSFYISLIKISAEKQKKGPQGPPLRLTSHLKLLGPGKGGQRFANVTVAQKKSANGFRAMQADTVLNEKGRFVCSVKKSKFLINCSSKKRIRQICLQFSWNERPATTLAKFKNMPRQVGRKRKFEKEVGKFPEHS